MRPSYRRLSAAIMLLIIAGLVSTAVLAPTVAAARFCQATTPPPPKRVRDTLPKDKLYTIKIKATKRGIEPRLIVMIPGHRVNVVFDNQTGQATNLLFQFPQSSNFMFGEDVPNGQQRSGVAMTPDIERTYYFYTSAHKALHSNLRNKNMVGTCIITDGVTQERVKPGQARDLVLVAREYFFTPSVPTAYPTERLRFTLINDGAEPHNFAIMVNDKPVSFPTPLEPGEVRSISAEAPKEFGKHVFYDPVGKNRSKGMEGALRIKQ